MAGQTTPFTVSVGDLKTIPLAYFPASIGVDNYTPVYIHFPDAGFGGFVKPFTLGAVIPAPGTSRLLRVSAIDVPSPGTYSAPTLTSVTASVAPCLAYEDPQPFSPGYPATTTGFQVAFASASRAAGTYTYDVPAQGFARGIMVFINVTAGTGTMTVGVNDRDNNLAIGSNNYVVSSSLANPSTDELVVYPGLTAVANSYASNIIGPTPRINVTVSTNPLTFAIDYALLP